MAIKVKRKILLINPGDVVVVIAEGNYVLLEQESISYLLREPISVVAKKLEPFGFVRIHRSVLVNASFVEEIKPYPTGEYGLRVKGGKEYPVTRTYRENLRSLAEFSIGTGGFFLNREPRLPTGREVRDIRQAVTQHRGDDPNGKGFCAPAAGTCNKGRAALGALDGARQSPAQGSLSKNR